MQNHRCVSFVMYVPYACVCVCPEMLVKVFGLGGLRPYFREKQNIFDFIVVSVSLPSIVLPLMAGSISQTSNLAAVSSFRAFRLFRVFRIARLLHKVTSMRNLLSAVLGSFTALMNLLFFIAFALVTFSIAATALFSRSLPPSPDLADAVDHNGLSLYATGQSPRYNFDSFFNSLVSLFIVMTGTATARACAYHLWHSFACVFDWQGRTGRAGTTKRR